MNLCLVGVVSRPDYLCEVLMGIASSMVVMPLLVKELYSTVYNYYLRYDILAFLPRTSARACEKLIAWSASIEGFIILMCCII